MIINILETKFKATKITEGQLLLEPTDDMHHIEAMEAQLDRHGEVYALVECRSETRGRKMKDGTSKTQFLGWSLAVPLVEHKTGSKNDKKAMDSANDDTDIDLRALVADLDLPDSGWEDT